ncbi:cyclophilin-like fold protein [Pseudonocardia hierapolitana]|uniref:cyclophilin-like fold protein n=1 Tax=Pseudonocardia hierapolitana TaxID=1128676 RepID=UPI0011BD509C|nr:cyclophilin-like fold protein [Pseudonocardia hierapolitana]
MSTTCTPWTGRAVGVTAVAVAVAVLVGCATAGGTTDPAAAIPAPPVSGMQVVLRAGGHAVGATLADTPAARELAGMLPLTVELTDAWGQAKTGRLPHPVTAEGAARTVQPVPGGIYYWPDTATLAVYYDDIGQSVPPPGLIHLGAVATGMDRITDAGSDVTVRIERSAAAHP